MYHQSSFWLSGERADINKRGREPFWPPRPSCEFFKNHLVTGPGGWLMMILALRMAMQCFLLCQIHITSLLTFPHQSDLKTQIKTARYTFPYFYLSKKADSLWPLVVCLSVRRQRTLNERISRTIESLLCLRCRKSLTFWWKFIIYISCAEKHSF